MTGAPITIHPGRDERAPLEALEILSKVGADINKTIMGHIERTIYDRDILDRLANTGCYVEWDLFGLERSYYHDNVVVRDLPNDSLRIDQLASLIDEGYEDKILISHDIGYKNRLASYGGQGYYYILANIIPRMLSKGFCEKTIKNILIENPKTAFTFS